MELVKDSGWILGKITAGTPTYIQNAGFVWLLSLVPLAFFGWFGMNNLLPVTPRPRRHPGRLRQDHCGCTPWPSSPPSAASTSTCPRPPVSACSTCGWRCR
jgi:hypothetical protein